MIDTAKPYAQSVDDFSQDNPRVSASSAQSVFYHIYSLIDEDTNPQISQIPKHWQAMPNRALFAEVKDRNHPDEPLLSVTIGKGIIRQSDLLANSSKKNSSNEDKAKYKLVQPRDIAYNKMRAWQGAVGVSNYRGIVSPAYIVVRPRGEQNSEYFHNLLRTPAFAKEAERWSYGITSDQWSLRAEDFKRIYCSLPSKEEQDDIVKFIDHVDNHINHLIRTKRRLIELLNEQKQVTIHKAVTRGIEPNVRLKPSGIDWLSDIPEHWEIVALRRFWEVADCKHLTVPFVEDGVPLASVVEVQSFDLDLTHCNKTTKEWAEHLISGGRKPKYGDLIYCRNVSVGACAYVNTNINFSMGQDVCLIRSDTHNQRYLNYLLHSWFMSEQLARLLVGSTFKRINISDIRSLIVLVPSKQEQDAICRELDEVVMKFASLIKRAESEIYLLREYRTRLISDVVTGKLDVHGVELPAMDEAESM